MGKLNRQKEVKWPKDIKRVSVTAAALERNERISEKTSQPDRLDVMSGPNGNRKPLKRRWKNRQVTTDQRKKGFRQISGDENEEKTCQQLQSPSHNCCHVVDIITSWYSVEGICILFDWIWMNPHINLTACLTFTRTKQLERERLSLLIVWKNTINNCLKTVW